MDEKDKLVSEILEKFNSNIEAKTKDFLKADEIAKVRSDFETSLKNMNEDQVKAFNAIIEELKTEVSDAKKLNDEIRQIVKNQAEEIDALKAPKVPEARQKMTKREQLEFLLKQSMISEEFAKFESKGFVGATNKMTVGGNDKPELNYLGAEKTVVPITAHTGTVMISEISDIVKDNSPIRTNHIRDFISVRPTQSAQIVAGQVYDFTDALTLGAIVVAENTEALESSFLTREVTWTLKRITHSLNLSKRWFKVNGLQWVIDHVLSKLPDGVFTVEDFEILFGDGSGNHVDGIAKNAQSFDLTYATYSATAFASVATYNSGTQSLITFAAAHGIKNGDNLIIANSSNYNGTHSSVEVVNAKQVVIDKAYNSETATGWTGSATSTFYRSIDNAQEADVLIVAASLLKAGEFMPTLHVINTQTQDKLSLLKDSQSNYLNIQKDANGRVVGIGGIPIAALTAMPAGKFITGDFSQRAIELREFTPFNIQFMEDTDTAKKNEIMLIVEEEIIVPIYNPYWFIYGKFSTAVSELETPSS